eukprot:4409463-Amphidinium_carterae.1
MVDSEAFWGNACSALPAATDGGEEKAPSQIVLTWARLVRAACFTLASKSKPAAPASSVSQGPVQVKPEPVSGRG